MRLAFHLSLGPVRVALDVGEDEDEVSPDIVDELVRLGADTAFGFGPDPLNRTWYTDDD